MRYVPNILSSIRIGLVPVFAIVFFSGHERAPLLALLIYIFASITDVLDGVIARKYKLISRVGTVLDPLADKLMLMTVLVCLSINHTLPLWVPAFIIINEVFMITVGSYMYLKKAKLVIPSNIYGKLATIVFFIAIILNIATLYFFSHALMTLALGIKIIALISYAIQYFNKKKSSSKIIV